MDSLVLKIVLGLVVLAAAGLFLRALLGGGKMLGDFSDRDNAVRQARLVEATAERQRQAAERAEVRR